MFIPKFCLFPWLPSEYWIKHGILLKKIEEEKCTGKSYIINIPLTSLTSFSISFSSGISQFIMSLLILPVSFLFSLSLSLPSSSSFVLSTVSLGVQLKVLCPLSPAETNTGHVRMTSPILFVTFIRSLSCLDIRYMSPKTQINQKSNFIPSLQSNHQSSRFVWQ